MTRIYMHIYKHSHRNTHTEKGGTFGTSVSTLMKITLLLLSIYLSDSHTLIDSLIHSVACICTHTGTRTTLLHITLTSAHSGPSLPLYISRRALYNGCTSPESFFYKHFWSSFINEHPTQSALKPKILCFRICVFKL